MNPPDRKRSVANAMLQWCGPEWCTGNRSSKFEAHESWVDVLTSLITGGAGFIGSHLADALVSRGEKVIILDDLSTGRVENIAGLRLYPGVRCFFDTLLNAELLADLIQEADVVFHLAACVGVTRVIQSPVRTLNVNIEGTRLLLEAAAPKKKLVFLASSSEVYGKNGKLPLSEDDDMVLGPTVKSRWSYAASKAVDEFLALSYWSEKQLPVIVGRLFNTAGRRQTSQYGMVLPTFVKQALSGMPITVFGNGQQTRCFAYVGDVVESILRLTLLERAVGEVVNIGNDEEIAIADLARIVRQRLGAACPIEFIGYEQAYPAGFEDVLRRVPSLEKLVRLTAI